jgi:DNA-directed RNA polymerase specialized sigma24 family protein
MSHRRTVGDRSISATGFQKLLDRLDIDSDRAAAEYERLRLALIKFFDWRGAFEPEGCADETIDRLVEKLQRETHVEDLWRYAHGIARLVLLESLRRQAQTQIVELPDLSNVAAVPLPEQTELRDCFERCLAALPAENRDLVLRYYEEHGRAKAENKRRLGQETGLSDTALRSRVQRIRDRLERCVEDCVSRSGVLAPTDTNRHGSRDPHTTKVRGGG